MSRFIYDHVLCHHTECLAQLYHYAECQDECQYIIEIGLEQAPFVVFVYFFPHLNMQKTLLIMGPKNTKTHQKV